MIVTAHIPEPHEAGTMFLLLDTSIGLRGLGALMHIPVAVRPSSQDITTSNKHGLNRSTSHISSRGLVSRCRKGAHAGAL